MTAMVVTLGTMPTFVTLIGTSALTGYTLSMVVPLSQSTGAYGLSLLLNDGVIIVSLPFSITVIANQAPTTTGLSSSTFIAQGYTKSLTIPSFTDPDVGDIASLLVSIVLRGNLPLPLFITNTGTQLVLNPITTTTVQVYLVDMFAIDQWGVSSPTITFTINVTPVEAPLFYLPLTGQTVKYPNTITLTYSIIDSF